MDPESLAQLRRVIGRLARQLNASSTVDGLTPSEASALGMIATRGPLTLVELVELEGLNPTMLSRVIRKLRSLGLIQRSRNPDNLRAALVEVTDAGQKVHERVTAMRSAALSECVARLSRAQVVALADALPALNALGEELLSARSTSLTEFVS